jgi:hypothetical protein
MVGVEGGPLELWVLVFYFVCALVGLFCVVALGYGPLFFVLLGAGLAILAFRQRRRSWWGLPLAASGIALVMAVGLGWRWRPVVEAVVIATGVVALVKIAGRLMDRRREVARR